MTTRHIAAEHTDARDLTPQGVSGAALRRFRRRLAADGFATDEGWRPKPGYLYTVVRAISARVNQNYDGWPSEELKKAYKTFIGKPCFVNHENHDPTKARGVVVAARYVENGMDKYIETVMEIDAGRFPKLAHEIKTGGLDSVSMGAEAGFTICSYCHNKATDLDDMCSHVRNHKGKTLTRFDKRTGKKEDVLVFESCHKISFFELSYVFEPADETAVASKVVVAGLHKTSGLECQHCGQPVTANGEPWGDWSHDDPAHDEYHDADPGYYDHEKGQRSPYQQREDVLRDPEFKQWSKTLDKKTRGYFGQMTMEDLLDSWHRSTGKKPAFEHPDSHLFSDKSGQQWKAVDRETGREYHPGDVLTDDDGGQHVYHGIDSFPGGGGDNPASEGRILVHNPEYRPGPRWFNSPRTLYPSVFNADIVPHTEAWNPDQHQDPFDPRLIGAGVHKHAGECPPGMDCSGRSGFGMEQITKDSPNNPVNQVSYTPGTIGQPGGSASGGYQGNGKSGRDGLNPAVRDFYDQVAKEHPDLSLGGYNPTVDQSWDEHHTGDAMDIMVSDLERGNTLKDRALGSGAKHVIWQQKLWYPGGGSEAMEDRGSPTENHYDHVHINMPTPSGYKAPTTTTQQVSQTTPAQTAPAQRAAGKTKERLDFPWMHCDCGHDKRDHSTGVHKSYDVYGCTESGCDCTKFQSVTKQSGKYTKDDFAIADGKKPWERETKSEDDEAIREIEAMLRTGVAVAEDDDLAANAKLTTALNTKQTYYNAHRLLGDRGAPEGPRLDVGSGKVGVILADDLGHDTYEPYPHDQFPPKYQSFGGEDGVPPASYGRVTNLNVLNVLPPEDRHNAIRQIGEALAPGGHALVTARKWKGDVERSAPHPRYLKRQPKEPNSVITGGTGGPRYQHGYVNHQELIDELQGVLGDGYAVTKAPVGPVGAHIVRLAEVKPSRRKVRSAALKKIARTRARKLAWGEKEAPAMVDTLREEGSAPEDDNSDDQRYVDPVDNPFENPIDSPAELQTPDLSQAAQIDRQQELAGGAGTGVPGPAEGGPPPQEDQGNFITLKIPMPSPAPQVPQQAGPPVAAPPPPGPQAPPPITAAVLDYFDSYYGRRVANWLDAIEANREFSPAEAADYRRQTEKLSTLENGRELSTTDRNPRKGTANMARTSLANRNKVATAGRRQHLAEGPLVDGGDRSRNDQGVQEEAFISQTPPEETVVAPKDDTNISNTEHNLVARVQRGRDQLLRDAQALASLRQRRAFDEAGGPVAEVVDPTVQTGPEGEALTGTDFVSANPNDGVVPTNPKDASLRAFQAFDGWLAAKTGKSSRRHSEATIKSAAAQFSREAGISPQALFPALGIVLREARKNDKQANTRGAKMRKRADEKLEVAAPDGRVDVEAPVSNTTDAEAQASQFDLHDFGNNAGDNVADPDLSTDQNWAPGEASKTSARVKTAGGLLAMRCAEGMIAAGLEPNSRERKYQLAAEFETMNRGLIQDRVALLERFAAVRQAERRKVASGGSRGAARSPIPAGLGSGSRTASAPIQRMAAHDPSNDSTLFI